MESGLVRVLCLGGNGMDKEINAAEYGATPAGYDVRDMAQAEAACPGWLGQLPIYLVKRPAQ